MRILNVTQSYAPFFEFGGPPAKVRALAEGLARMGNEVTVLTADWGLQKRLSGRAEEGLTEASPFGQRRKVNGVTAIYLANWFRYRAVSWNPALGRYLRARLAHFDAVHIFGLYDFLGPRVAQECRALRIPYVIEPIGMYVPIVRNVRLKQLYHRLFGNKLFAGASAVIATAEQERAELIAGGVAAEKIVVRRNGVDVPEVFPERGRFRAVLKIPATAKLVLFLGRLSKKKSPQMLLQAFGHREITQAAGEREVHLAFVGPDEAGMLAKLQTMARELGVAERVHFTNALEGDAKWSAYRDADIFVLPSQNENFGNTAAEAVAAGTPVIVTDHCGIAPLLKDVAGVVVKYDAEEVAVALKELLRDDALYGRLQSGCRAALQNLGWSQPLAEMDALYRTLVKAGPSQTNQVKESLQR
ncbi:MAG TPA: glycosyltransferase [Candidatus Acidoferrum sp.]|jgi:glycosyltransferase involved in cell wall biosynthesis